MRHPHFIQLKQKSNTIMKIFIKSSIAVEMFCFFTAMSGAEGQTSSAGAVDASTLENKFLFGYQGFFRRPGEGNDHWTASGNTPGPSVPGDGKTPNSLMLQKSITMLAASFQRFILAGFQSLTAQSPIRFLPRSRTVSRRVSLHQRLHPSERISSLALRI